MMSDEFSEDDAEILDEEVSDATVDDEIAEDEVEDEDIAAGETEETDTEDGAASEEAFQGPGEAEDLTVAHDSPFNDELDAIINPPAADPPDVEPLPQVGPSDQPAVVELWHDGQKQDTLTLAFDKLLFGASPADEPADADASTTTRRPDIDLREYGIDQMWRQHVEIHRRNRHHYVYPLADATLQLNDEPLSIGDARELTDGDIIVAGPQTALVFRDVG